MEKKHGTHKVRGCWLTFLLIVMALHGIFGTALYHTIRTQDAPNYPWLISLMVLHSLLNVIAAAGIWEWKRWGLQIYAVSTVMAIVVGLVSVGIWSLFYMFLPLAILGWAIRTKWDYFD